MTAHIMMISSILAALLLTCTIKAALADFDWNTGTGITWAYRSTDPNSLSSLATPDGGRSPVWREADPGNRFYLTGASAGATGERIYHPAPSAAKPIPAAVWLLSSGIIGFIGIRRRN